MNEITESLYTEKLLELDAIVQSQRAQITALVYKAGKGKNVSISKGEQRQADKAIGTVTPRRMSSGEIRFTVEPPEKNGGGDG